MLERIIYRLQKWLRPTMIGGFKFAKDRKGIRISNHTHISYPHNLDLGDDVFIAHFSYIDCYRKIVIGRNVHIGSYVSILTHSAHVSIRLHGLHYSKDASDLKGLQTGTVEIGDFSSIGPHSTIMPGTKIGLGTIVSAYSYVKPGKYPDFAILKGNPAKVVGSTRELDSLWLDRYPELSEKYYLKHYDLYR